MQAEAQLEEARKAADDAVQAVTQAQDDGVDTEMLLMQLEDAEVRCISPQWCTPLAPIHACARPECTNGLPGGTATKLLAWPPTFCCALLDAVQRCL